MTVPGCLDTELPKSFSGYPCLPPPNSSRQVSCDISLGILASAMGPFLLTPELCPPQLWCLPSQGYCFMEASPHLYPQIGWARNEVPVFGTLLVYHAYLFHSILYSHWPSGLFSCWDMCSLGGMAMLSSFVPISSSVFIPISSIVSIL